MNRRRGMLFTAPATAPPNAERLALQGTARRDNGLHRARVGLLASVSTDGPAIVTYHWKIGRDGVVRNILPDEIAYFTYDGTLDLGGEAYVNCSNYFARLVVTHPNSVSSQVDFLLTIPTLLPIYDFDTFDAVGAIACGEVVNYAWTPETCKDESGGCWVSATPLFDRNHAGSLRHDGITVCGLNLP